MSSALPGGHVSRTLALLLQRLPPVRRLVGYHIPFKRLNSKRLIAAIDSVLAPPVTQNVVAEARQFKDEDGVGETIRQPEGYFLQGVINGR